jgi:hypothetical protein
MTEAFEKWLKTVPHSIAPEPSIHRPFDVLSAFVKEVERRADGELDWQTLGASLKDCIDDFGLDSKEGSK